MIFDTSALLAILRDREVLEKLGEVDTFRIPSICAFELLRGPFISTFLRAVKGSWRS